MYKKRVANAALFSFWLGGSWRGEGGSFETEVSNRMCSPRVVGYRRGLSFYTLLGLSFLGNQERTTLIIVIYLALNSVLFIVQKLILRKNLKLNNLSTNKLEDKGGH